MKCSLSKDVNSFELLTLLLKNSIFSIYGFFLILGCGGNFTTPSGSIVSPNYPNNYPHNTDCEWLITVEERHSVVLTFADFDVEGAADCSYDYVVVSYYHQGPVVQN